MVKFTKAQRGSKILDVATGTGKQAFAFAKKGYEVIGIDISEAMLNVAKKSNCVRPPHPKQTVRQLLSVIN